MPALVTGSSLPQRVLLRLAREPLVLFFAIGGALFWLAPKAERGGDVHLSARGLRSLAQAEARRSGVASLSPAAVAEIKERAVDDELLYREGLRLGLDKNDNIVRQRVIEKVRFLAEDLGGSSRPVTDAELAGYLEAHADAWRRPTVVSFIQVYSAADPKPLARIAPTLLSGTDGAAAEPPSAGSAFPLGRRVVDASLDDVRANYGAGFAAALSSLEIGRWSAPVRSLYGFHLVKVIARRDGGSPALAEVRGDVLASYLQERKALAGRRYRAGLRSRYRVTIDDIDEPVAGGAFAIAASAAAREAD